MDDAEFEAALAEAFQTPAEGAVRRDMTGTVLQRVRKTGWARAGVLAGSGLIGVAIAGSTLAATQLAGPAVGWALRGLDDLAFAPYPADASPFIVLGLALMGLMAVRNTIRDL